MPDLNQSIRDRFARLTSSVLERHVTKKAIQEALSAGEFDFVINDPDPDPQLLAWKKDPDATAAVPRLQAAKDALVDADFTSSEAIKDAVWPLTETFGRGELLWPLRTALTGQERSPDPFTVAYTLGKDTTLTRIDIACAKITA